MGPFPRRLQAVRFHFGWRLLLGGAEEAGMKGWRERAADIFAKHGEIAAKMKSALGPGTTISRTALMCRCRDAGLRGPLERTLK